jgi:two-component system cell cycle response regulator
MEDQASGIREQHFDESQHLGSASLVQRPRRILIADDESVTCSKLHGLLTSQGYEVVVARNGTDAWECLQRDDAPLLAILDWMMPAISGVDICRRLRASKVRPYVYAIILTAKDERPDLIKAMEAGADDYLSKPFDADELRVRLAAGWRVLALQDELRTRALHDDLTGLLNRGGILDVARREVAKTLRLGAPTAVVLADIDHFKDVNDVHGHAVGDAVLNETAQRFSAQLRDYDALGRYGGEEFLAVLPGCDATTAARVAERMRAALSDTVVTTRGQDIRVSASFGVAAVAGAPELGVAELIGAADKALYRAKSGGRNRVEVAAGDSVAEHNAH